MTPRRTGAQSRETGAAPRVVLDTNVVLSAVVFGGQPARLRVAWQAGRLVPLASRVTAREFLRVLSYPKFALSAEEQAELVADYMPWVQVVDIPDPPPATPACRDPFDRPFLELARAGRAIALVTGDRDLLSVARMAGLCPVLSVDAFCEPFLAD